LLVSFPRNLHAENFKFYSKFLTPRPLKRSKYMLFDNSINSLLKVWYL